jgi:hypothetical protein
VGRGRHAAALARGAGDRLVLALDGGRVDVLDADGRVAADFSCGECDALAVARTRDGARVVVAGARGLAGFDQDGAPRFELALDGRVSELLALDVDGDGDDELLSLLDGGRGVVWSSEREVRFKAGRDVRDFAVVAPDRILVVDEGGDAPCLLAGDGRRLASIRLPCTVTALDVADVGALRCGADDGRVRELRLPAGDEGDALLAVAAQRASGPPVTALAHGAVGDGGSARTVRGDANGSVTFALSDGGGDVSLTVRAGHPVLALAVGDVDGRAGDETFAALRGGTLVGFKTGGAPQKRVELGGECTALALLDVEGTGGARRDVVVALEGGELRWFDGALERRGSLRAGSTVTSLVPLDRARRPADAPLAAAGTAGGELLLLRPHVGGGMEWTKVAELGVPVLAVAVADADARAPGPLLIAGLTATRVVVVTAEGTRFVDAPASGRSVALSDLDGDGRPELIHVDGAGRLAVRAAAPRPAAHR